MKKLGGPVRELESESLASGSGPPLLILSSLYIPMPYVIEKVPGGYKIRNLRTGKHYSNSPMTLAVARKQLSVLNRAGY
jgi:hypothetical protein